MDTQPRRHAGGIRRQVGLRGRLGSGDWLDQETGGIRRLVDQETGEIRRQVDPETGGIMRQVGSGDRWDQETGGIKRQVRL